MTKITTPLDEERFRSRVQLNISGTPYETYLETLQRFPSTLLGDMTKRRSYLCGDEYYFNRNRTVFDSILFFYQSYGRLMRPLDVPHDDI